MDFMRFILLLICCAFLQTAAFAQNTLPPIEAYGSLPNQSMVVISPSGNRIAYRSTSADKDFMIVYDLVENKLVSAVSVENVKPTSVYFISETKLIFVVESNVRLYGYRGRHDYSAAFVYSTEDKKVFQLLMAGYGIYSGQSELGRILAISEDQKFAYMPAWQDVNKYSIYRVKLDNKSRPRVVKKGKSDVIDYFINPDGSLIARERYNNKTNVHRVEAYRDGDWHEIYREEAELRSRAISGLTPDKKSLVIKSFDPKLQRWGYFKMSLQNGEISPPIFIREDADVESLITDVNRVVYGVAYSGFKPSYEFFDKKLTQKFDAIAKSMPENSFILSDYSENWDSFIFRFEGNGSVGDFYKYSDDGFGYITTSRNNIKSEQVHPVVVKHIKARDGLTIPTLVTKPIGFETKNLPAIMLPHGGPESYDRLAFDWQAQFFASQGYVVIQPQFRGSSGFGEAHAMMGEGQWGLKMQDDLTDALKSLVDEGMVNPDRVCIVGASYGGYAALAGLAFEPELYRCAVSINGVSDVEQMMKDEKRQYGSHHWVVSYWERIIANGQVADDHLEKISPINHVEKINKPVLLIHGQRDLVVPMKQSEMMYEELIDAEKTVEFIELEKGDHYLRNFQNRMAALKAIDVFIKKHI